MKHPHLDQQERFIQRIADRLGRPRITEAPIHPFRGAPEFWQSYALPMEERIEMFMDHWRNAGGYAQRVADMAMAMKGIAEIAASVEARTILQQDQLGLQQLPWQEELPSVEVISWDATDPNRMKSIAAIADIGVTIADYAVAYTGSIVSLSSPKQGRLVSLLPSAVIVIIPISQLKTKLGEVMAEIEALQPEQMPAGIHWISGPSRSADIENDLTIGVHGPGEVYALLLEQDLSSDISCKLGKS